MPYILRAAASSFPLPPSSLEWEIKWELSLKSATNTCYHFCLQLKYSKSNYVLESAIPQYSCVYFACVLVCVPVCVHVCVHAVTKIRIGIWINSESCYKEKVSDFEF